MSRPLQFVFLFQCQSRVKVLGNHIEPKAAFAFSGNSVELRGSDEMTFECQLLLRTAAISRKAITT